MHAHYLVVMHVCNLAITQCATSILYALYSVPLLQQGVAQVAMHELELSSIKKSTMNFY